jgi:hypothetical protein
MKDIRIILVLLLIFASELHIFAQETKDSLLSKTNVKPFVTLYHQHHDFFGKAFSFQGIEGGVIVQRNLYLAFYGAFFASNLKTEADNEIKYVWIGQGGINAAYIIRENSRFRPGCQLNMGIFTLRHDAENFGLFETDNAFYELNGIIVSPQIFGELLVTEWFKIRTGFSYNFYSFNDYLMVKPSDLNHLSFTFGLVFILNKVNLSVGTK